MYAIIYLIIFKNISCYFLIQILLIQIEYFLLLLILIRNYSGIFLEFSTISWIRIEIRAATSFILIINLKSYFPRVIKSEIK